MPKQITWSKAFTIGIVGSLLFKLIEYTMRWEIDFLGGVKLQQFLGVWVISLQLIFLIAISSGFVLLFKAWKFPNWTYLFIPFLYRVFASFYNFFLVTDLNGKILLVDNVEAIIFGLIVGYTSYKLFKGDK